MGNISKNKYASEWEEVKKRKKESADNSTPSNQNKYASEWEDVRKNMFLSSLPSRLESLTSSRNELSKNYNSRFFDKDGNYINSYRGDTKDALTSFETSRANVSKEYESLLSDLTKYEKYFDAEKVKTLKDYLTTYGSDMQSMYDTYKLDSDTYSRYADEDAYNRAMAYAKEQDEKVKKYSSMTDDELEAELKALEDSKKGNAFTNFAMKVIGAQQDIKSGTNLYAEGEANQEHNENVDYDIALIEKEKTNRKYKQIDELPGSVKALVDELTVIDSTNDDEEFANKMATILSGFTGGNNVNYNVGSGSERRGEIIRELESMGVKNWQELLDYNKLRYNEKKNAATKEEYAQMAKEHPVLSSLVSIPASLGNGIGTLEMLENIGSDAPLDPNSPYFGMNDLSNTIRETVMDEHNYHLNTGIEAIDNIDIFDELYNTGMSTGDSVMAGLGGMGVKGLGGTVLGLSAASDAAQEVAERGGSSTEAITTGLVSGVNEMLWESLSLGKLDDLISNGVKKRGFVPFVKELLKSMGINASEEFNTEAANLIADYVINGGASTYAETVQNYLSAGYTHDEAKKLANKDMLSQTAKAGVSGALQGLLMGVGGGALSTTANAIDSKSYENKFYNKMGSNVVENNNVSQLAEEAKSLGNSKLRKLANVAEAVNVGELDPKEAKKYVHQVGKLYKGVQKAQFDNLIKTSETAFRNVIKSELEKSGVADTDAVADILVKAMHNKGLTRAENRKFQSVDGRSILDKVLYSAEFNKTLDAEQKKQFTEGFDKFVNTESLAGRTLTDRKADLVSKAGYKSGVEKTFVDATDEVVDSLKVNSIKGDTITLDVKLGENNQVVAADELTFDNDYAVIISGLQSISKDFGLDVDSANRVLALWESYDGDSFDFYKTAQSGIMYGQYNQKKYFDNATFGNVPDNIRNELYNIGKEYRQKVTDTKAKAIKERSIPNGEVKVTFAEGVQYHKLTKSQKAQVDMAQIIARAFGFNLEVFRSPKVNGKSVGENGSFSPSANLMRLDIDAGTLDGKALILFTQGHELTHFIKAWSETAYKNFADFLIEKYTDKDVPLNDLVQKKIRDSIILAQSDKTGKHKELSYDEALEEVVCDACEDFLADPNIQQTILEIAKVDQSLADKIKNFIKNLINRLEKALRGLQGQSEAAGYTRSLDANDLQELKDLWTSALVEARENVLQAKARGGETQKNTTAEGDVKFMARSTKNGIVEYTPKEYNDFGWVAVNKILTGKELKKLYAQFSRIKLNKNYNYKNRLGEYVIPVGDEYNAIDHIVYIKGTNKHPIIRQVVGFIETISDEDRKTLTEDVLNDEYSKKFTDAFEIAEAYARKECFVRYMASDLPPYSVYRNRTRGQNSSRASYDDRERSNGKRNLSDSTGKVQNRDGIKLQDRDSLGRTLSETQQSYFADSKIRDKNGNLMVMYHGSPKDDISSFRLSLGGAYFTANSDYAREYARDVGKVYEVYLNITKPFDTRNAECRAIFEKEFYGQWGNGAPLGDKGLPDWTDGDDLIDFLQEKGYDYDGLLLDEGGVPVGNGVKDRGISYVVFDRANQVKYTDNVNPTTNEDMKFAMRENVEETKDLVAVHNLSEEKLLKSLTLGGLPMPSIAIIKAKNGHNVFGDISLVFDKSTIDPKASRYNKVFTSDAYTPTYPNIDYKIDSEVVEKGVDEVERLIKSKGYNKDDFGYLSSIDGDSFRYGNTDEVAIKTALKVAYLIDKGIDFTPVYEEKQYSGFGRFDNEAIKYVADAIGKERINELHNNSEGVKNAVDEIRNLANEQRAEKYKDSWFKPKLYGENFGFSQAHEIVEGAYNYFNSGTQTKIDEWQTSREIKDLINNDDYKNWVDNLFAGFIEKEGIRNNADLFTPSGNRRSFEALHWEHNLENVVKSMRKGLQQGKALFGGSIYGAAQAELKSIADIKNESDRLVDVYSEESDTTFVEKRKDLELRFTELVSSIVRDNGSNLFMAMDDASSVLVESVLKCKTKTAMDNYIKKELEGWGNYSNTLADDLIDIVKELRALPTGYFEAKPQRAVMFDEVATAIIPDNTSMELKQKLTDNGVKFIEYENGNDESRINALNSIEDVKFQDRVTPEQDAEYLELAKNPEKNEARLREMVDAVARANGYTIKAYHGTKNAGFVRFEYNPDRQTGDDFGKAYYSTTDYKTAQGYSYDFTKDPRIKEYKNNRERLKQKFLETKSEEDKNNFLNYKQDGKTLLEMLNDESYITGGGEVKKLFLKIDNPLRVDANGKYHYEVYEQYFKQARKNNHDGIIVKNVIDVARGEHRPIDVYITFDSNQMKSADLVTYDDNGNIIPLSERFNEGNNDIRYQDRPYQPSLEVLGIDYKAENDKLKADVDRLNKLLKLQRTLTHGALFTKTSVDKAASLIMKEFGLHRGKSDLSEKLNALYTFVASSNDLTWDEFYDRASQVANWMIDSKPDQRYYKNPYASEVLKNIRERGITLNEKQKEEAAYYAGSLNAYRKSNIGNFRIVNEGGISLTELWEQLVKDYPGAFSQEDIEKGKKDTNLPSLIVEVIGTMRQTESVLEQLDRTQEVRKMVEKIYDTYWNVTTLHTLADKHQKEVNLLKGKHRAEMDALKEKGDENLKQVKERYRDMLQKVREDKDAKMTAYKEHVAEQRHKSVEGRNKTATKNKIKRVVKELDKLLNKGNKKSNVKDGMQDMVKQALALSDLLLGDVISAETILSADIPDERLSKNESAMLKKWRDAVDSRAKFQAAIDNLEAKYGSSKPMETYEELVNSIAIANKHIKAAEKNLSELLERERKRLNSDSVKAAIESLSKAYEMLKESNVDYISSAYDENISDKLKNLVESLEGVNVKDMSMGDLQEVYTAYKMVLTTVRNANKLFVNGRKENFDEINALILQEINFHKEKRESKFETIDKALEGARNFTHNNLKPLYFFEELGSNALKRIFYDEIARAQRVYAMDWQESREYIENARKKHNYYSWDNNSQTIKLLDGRTVKFSMQELMSIYAYSKRPQADKHMSEGGFAFDNKAFFKDVKEDVDGKKVKTRELRSDAETPYRITEFELEKIKKLLGKERIEYVDDMQKYLSEDMANKGNSVTRVMYGIDIFNEKVYFPLKSSKDYKIPVSTTNAEFALKGSGFTKETEPAARNPIVLQGFDDVWAKHVNEMSTYHSLVLPIENMNKVLGYTEYIDTPNSLSTKEKIRKVYGGSALKYIENYIQDMNGGFSSNKGAQNFFAKGFSNFKKTAVGASMSTVIQQPTAVLRAMSMVKPKYFVGYETANHKALQDERLKYAPISIIKRIGGFDAGGNRSAVQALLSKEFEGIDKTKAFFKDKEYRKEKFDDAMMLGATFADEIGWNIIWNAVKNEVKDTTTFTPGSDEFFNECGNRFDEVVNATQVYDSVLSRSGYMRSNNELVKMSTAFMGEPSTSFNMLYNAVTQAKRGNISKNKAVGIVTSVYISVIAAAALKSLIYALRDDDDEESYVEKYMSALVNSLSEELFVHNMLPFLSDIATMFDGWEVERTDMAVFKDVVDAVNDLDSDSKSPYRKAEDLFGAFAGLFGIPLKNVSRTGREIYNMFANILDDNTAGEGDILDAIEETAENAFYGNIIVDKITGGYKGGNSASDVNVLLDKGNTAKAKETINELVADKVESGKTEKEAKASIKASVTSYWKDLYLQAYRNKDNAEMLRIRRILQATGLYDDVLTTCSNWIKGMKDETTDTGFTKW